MAIKCFSLLVFKIILHVLVHAYRSGCESFLHKLEVHSHKLTWLFYFKYINFSDQNFEAN